MVVRIYFEKNAVWAFRGAVAVAGLLVACSNSVETESASTTRQAVESSAQQRQIQLSLTLPAAAALNQVAVGSVQLADIGDRVQTRGSIFSTLGDTNIGADAKVGSLFVNGTATLHDRAAVTGNVLAKSIVKPPTAAVSGTSTQTSPMPSPVNVVWTVSVGAASLGDVALEPDQSRDLTPGTYGHFSVKSRSSVTLHSGVYELSDFFLDSQAKLVIDSSHGPVQVVVDGNLTYRGATASATPDLPQVLFAVMGAAVEVESPFIGAIVAPQAAVHFQAAQPQGHRAFVFGATVKLEPDTKFASFPFDWTTVVGSDFNPIPANAIHRDVLENSLGLTLSIAGDGTGNRSSSATSATPRTFTLRPDQTVGGGVIGNGTLTFRYRSGTGVWVTCTYKGQSSVPAPNTPDELIKGTHLVFQSCTDGLAPGAGRTGDQFQMSAVPASGYPVTLKSPMLEPKSCDDDMELLSPDQTRQMREGFDWSKAKKVDGTTPDGRATLYYAWIYIRNKDEALALQKLYIHVLAKPLFDDELAHFAGRCGVFTNPGDGTGSFVPVLIPGNTYNKLVDALTSSDIQGSRTVFDAVIIRTDVPAAARNPDNSVNLDVLGKAGFHYLSYEVNPFADPATMTLNGGAARALVGVLEWVGQAARDAGEVVTGLLNKLDQLFRGTVSLTFYMEGLTADVPFSQGPMIRGWGPQGGQRLAAEGMEVKVLQRLFGLPIPTTAQDDTDIDGVAHIDATDDSSSRGSGLCIEMRNSAALITDFLLASEMCDLRGYVATHVPAYAGAYANPEVADYQFTFSSAKTDYVLGIDNTRLMGLYQADDVYQYARRVVGFEAPRARILSGMWANTFAPTNPNGRKKLITPCLNFPNSLNEAMTAAAGGVGALAGATVGSIVPGVGTGVGAAVGAIAAGTYAAVIGNTDIVMSTESSLHESRAVMSHEYGHYEFCSMIDEVNSAAVDHVVWGTIIGGNAINYPLRYTNEAVADFFMGQVSGGADYNWANGFSDSISDTYCDSNTVNPNCWDENLDGTNGRSGDPGRRNIGRVATLFEDVFDGQGVARTTYAPTNADSFVSDANAKLSYSSTSYGSKDENLERVHAPGSAIRTMLHDLAAGMKPFFEYSLDDGKFEAAGNAIDVPKIWGAANHAMLIGGANWCDRCRLFALHEPGVDLSNLRTTFASCAASSNIALALGEPAPDPNLRIKGDTCSACPPGSTSDDNGVCHLCVGEIVGNTCEKCVSDVVIDASTLTSATLPFDKTFDVTASTPGDNCPDTFWVEIDTPSAAFNVADHLTADVGPLPETDANCARAYTLISALPNASTGYFTETNLLGTGVPETTCSPKGGLCLGSCTGLPSHEVSRTEAAASVIRFGSPVMSNTVIEVQAFADGAPPR